jgi:micrococcal nuclease
MKKLFTIITLLFLFSCDTEAKNNFYVYNVEVIDGDTLRLDTSNDCSLLKELGLTVRIYGVDTPEKKGKCQKEKDLANIATQFVKNLIGKKEVMIEVKKWDKFGGRILGDVQVDGLNIADELIKQGLAIPYFGEKKIKDWCL